MPEGQVPWANSVYAKADCYIMSADSRRSFTLSVRQAGRVMASIHEGGVLDVQFGDPA